ncbi:hypothetical protein D3C80_2123090 [compost metagenome]
MGKYCHQQQLPTQQTSWALLEDLDPGEQITKIQAYLLGQGTLGRIIALSCHTRVP